VISHETRTSAGPRHLVMDGGGKASIQYGSEAGPSDKFPFCPTSSTFSLHQNLSDFSVGSHETCLFG
jgi:hypothetical protein